MRVILTVFATLAIALSSLADDFTELINIVTESRAPSLNPEEAEEYSSLAALVGQMKRPVADQGLIVSTIKEVSPLTTVASVSGTLDFLSSAYSFPDMSHTESLFNEANGNSPLFIPTPTGNAFLPITGRITSGFGYRPSFGRIHKGIDISLHTGDTVCCALDGTVTRVDTDPQGYGLFIVVSHSGGMETRYAHLSRALAIAGTPVTAGQPIALGGSTGNSTGPHLHFETRYMGTAFDPSRMFDFSMPGKMRCHRSLHEIDKATAGNIADTKERIAEGKSTYIVRPGDTIAVVARKTGLTTLALCRLNMLSSTDRLEPGRMLRLR